MGIKNYMNPLIFLNFRQYLGMWKDDDPFNKNIRTLVLSDLNKEIIKEKTRTHNSLKDKYSYIMISF